MITIQRYVYDVHTYLVEITCRLSSRDAFAPFLPIDISIMSGCRHLSLRCLPLPLFCGLVSLRDRLESLSVSYCRNVRIEDVLAQCLADNVEDAQPWNQLKRLSLR